jgi:hypothetical protein
MEQQHNYEYNESFEFNVNSFPPENQSIPETPIFDQFPALLNVAAPENYSSVPFQELPLASSAENTDVNEKNDSNVQLNDVVRTTDTSAKNLYKKGRRIMMMTNADDSDENEDISLKNEILNNSSELEKSFSNDAEKHRGSDADVSANEDIDDTLNLTDPGALKARFLLKRAILIKGPEIKKKKHRILESDDEDEYANLTTISVDDIGQKENEDVDELEENFQAPILDDIVIINENPFEHQCEEQSAADKLKNVQVENTMSEETIPEISDEQTNENKCAAAIPGSEEIKVEDENLKLKEEKHENEEIDASMNVEAILENIKPMDDDE